MTRPILPLVLVLLAGLVVSTPAAEPQQKTESTKKTDSSYAFENSLGMKFVALPDTKVLMCIWKTRVEDYAAFVQANRREWHHPDFEQGKTHPVVDVSWEDAMAFCNWLTNKEAAAKILPTGWKYRLPTDAEWSQAVGLKKPKAETDEKLAQTLYPWGTDWPPPKGAGNYHPSLGVDSYSHTSPVGSFHANALGLYDLGGNAWEWCMDVFNESANYRILRGGSWNMKSPGDLLDSTRVGNQSDIRLDTYGFRCVIEKPE